MEIRIAQGHAPDLLEDAVSIVIDVIRAYTMTHYAFQRGARRVFLFREIEEVRAAKRDYPEALMAGERKSKGIEGFDMQNSPAEVAGMDLSGRTLLMTTTNGVPAALHAMRFGPTLVTGFSNARATARYARDRVQGNGQARINIVGSHPTGEEDMLCAEFIAALLQGRETEACAGKLRDGILGAGAARKFLDPQQPDFDPADMEYCCRECDSNFAMTLRQDVHPVVEPTRLSS